MKTSCWLADSFLKDLEKAKPLTHRRPTFWSLLRDNSSLTKKLFFPSLLLFSLSALFFLFLFALSSASGSLVRSLSTIANYLSSFSSPLLTGYSLSLSNPSQALFSGSNWLVIILRFLVGNWLLMLFFLVLSLLFNYFANRFPDRSLIGSSGSGFSGSRLFILFSRLSLFVISLSWSSFFFIVLFYRFSLISSSLPKGSQIPLSSLLSFFLPSFFLFFIILVILLFSYSFFFSALLSFVIPPNKRSSSSSLDDYSFFRRADSFFINEHSLLFFSLLCWSFLFILFRYWVFSSSNLLLKLLLLFFLILFFFFYLLFFSSRAGSYLLLSFSLVLLILFLLAIFLSFSYYFFGSLLVPLFSNPLL